MSSNLSRSSTPARPSSKPNTASSRPSTASPLRRGPKYWRAGGDAVDAAVAISFVIGVLEPWMSGPAGGGAMMLWRAEEGRPMR